MNEDVEIVRASITRVQRWVEERDYVGYEPFDGLSSFLRSFTFGNLLLDRLLLQLIRQSPINLRPLLGVKPQDSTIGRGYMARGYLDMYRITEEERYRRRAVNCLEWLMQNKFAGYREYAWGKHFDFASRTGHYSKLEPITVWTGLIGHAFLDGYEMLHDDSYLDVAQGISKWILQLPIEQTNSGLCLSYYAFEQNSIHNSNMIGASILARTATHTGSAECLELAKQAMKYSCSRQLSSGGWYYGEAPQHHWIDNFHTGYNLDSLKCYIEYTGDRTKSPNLQKGFQFFANNFFEADGRPKYYHDRTYPIDSQCASQAIETLANFADCHSVSLPLALMVAKWTIENMQDQRGHFYYRKYPLIKAKTPMLHWAQATTYRALTHLLSKLEEYRNKRSGKVVDCPRLGEYALRRKDLVDASA
jgi:hypothetical protein